MYFWAISRATSMYTPLRVGFRGFHAVARCTLFRLRLFRYQAHGGVLSATFRKLTVLPSFRCVRLSSSACRSQVMSESPPVVAVTPEQGRGSPEQGQRGFCILREIPVICNGRALLWEQERWCQRRSKRKRTSWRATMTRLEDRKRCIGWRTCFGRRVRGGAACCMDLPSLFRHVAVQTIIVDHSACHKLLRRRWLPLGGSCSHSFEWNLDQGKRTLWRRVWNWRATKTGSPQRARRRSWLLGLS